MADAGCPSAVVDTTGKSYSLVLVRTENRQSCHTCIDGVIS